MLAQVGSDRRRHALVRDADAAHPALRAAARARHSRVEDPRDRSGRRRRLRLEAPGLRRRPARDRAGAAPRPPREVDGGARRELRRHDPRPRRRARADVRRDGATGRSPRCKSEAWCAMGAYLELVTPGIPLLGAWIYSGPYEIPNYSVTFTGVFTHTTPTDAYRGAGRPEATYVLERTMDALARELGMDPVELRRKNFVKEFPHTMASGLTIDSGDYDATLDRLLELLDLDAIRADQAARRASGDVKQIGVGFSTYNEMCGLAPSRILGAIRYAVGGWDAATIRFQPLGSVQVVIGHVAARSEPRDDVRADRRRPARRRRRRRRGAPRRHRRLPAGHGHVRQPIAHGRRDRALPREREDHREGAADRRAPARGVRGRPRVRGRDVHA